MERSFWAYGEDGRRVGITGYPQYADMSTRDSETHETAENMSVYRTDEGLTVNVVEKGKYQVVQTGEILRSDDPNAP